jgi:aryl-alcohol dehydrogenase-like predicted oxidoreductase
MWISLLSNGFWDLSGKFLTGENILTQGLLFPQFARYNSAQCAEATKLYQEIARKNGLTLTELSLAFIEQQSL